MPKIYPIPMRRSTSSSASSGICSLRDRSALIAEMRRVLKPSGRIAFATWPPDRLVGQTFAFVGRNGPPLPPGVPPPVLWGKEEVIAERLGDKFEAPTFERGVMTVPALSLHHYRLFMETSIGPIQKLMESLADSPERLETARRELEAIVAPYYDANLVKQEYLLTKASAR